MISKSGLAKTLVERQVPALGRWKTDQNDPRKHDTSHLGLIYEFPKEPSEFLPIVGREKIFNKEYTGFLKTIDMVPIMVRKPALTVMDKMRENLTKTENEQILIYGDPGHGKRHTLAHLLHFNYLEQNRFLLHLGSLGKLACGPKEHKLSTSRPGRIDTPLDSAAMLQIIRVENQEYMAKNKDSLVCSKDYKWSAREVTKAGEPLDAIIDHGLNRVIHSSDCLAVLIKELMLAADEGKIKLLTIMNKVDWLFHYYAGQLKHPDFKRVTVDEMTVPRALKKLIKSDHKNSLLIATCDDLATNQQNQTPETILPEDGITYFEKAHRILVPKYSRLEFENCYNFYQDIGWLTRPESRTQEVRDEVRFLSGLNPYHVWYLCKPL